MPDVFNLRDKELKHNAATGSLHADTNNTGWQLIAGM